MHQLALNFTVASELRKDTTHSTATVAHRGGGILISNNRGLNRKGKGHAIAAAQITGLSASQVSGCIYYNNAPKPAPCFGIWYLCHKRKKQVKSILAKVFGVRRRSSNRYRKIRLDPVLKAKHYARTSERRRTIEGKAKRNQYARRWRKKKYHYDPQFRLATIARARITKVLKIAKLKKSYRTHVLLGCAPSELKIHIESQFRPGMTWQNHGWYWHIDHKRPLAAFDLSDRTQLLSACHYSNLQPLTAFENMSKGAKLIYEKAA